MAEGGARVFGIRHHGPGSARSLADALEALQPQAVLIEGPPEANDILGYAAAPGMRPPLALLVHAADDPSLALFYPFAEYSPEWVALRWALERRLPARLIDAPAAARLALLDEQRRAVERAEEGRGDPLASLAELAGYADAEAWWNDLIEQAAHAPELFDAVERAMAALREDRRDEGPGALWEARREAHMRLELRRAEAEFQGAIAVVVGAWHAPALTRRPSVREDRELLRGLPRLKATAAWIPWTDARLAYASGYGAGIASPGWYRHLWSEFAKAPAGALDVRRLAIGWQARVAALLREGGQAADTASVIEAARLAEALAALRGLATPGLPEMRDASLSTLCRGEPVPLRLIEERLVVGTEVGAVDDGVPQVPLQADLARWQRRLRLKPEAVEKDVSLDLRSEAGLQRSVLLHRLLLIDVPWGELTEAEGGRGTFRERWRLLWRPELSVGLAEAAVWGSTLEQAATARAAGRAAQLEDPASLAELAVRCLLADLPEAADRTLARLQGAAAAASEIGPLLEAAPPLAQALRYGTARRMPGEALTALIEALAAEVGAGLVYACRLLEPEAARDMLRRLAAFDGAILLLEASPAQAEWAAALRRLADDREAEPLLLGFAARRLHERGEEAADVAGLRLSRALSPGAGAEAAAAWLEGFFADAPQILLHDHALHGSVDAWLRQLEEVAFVSLLPALRRTFAALDPAERRRLLDQPPRSSAAAEAPGEPASGAEAFARALPLLKTILGLER